MENNLMIMANKRDIKKDINHMAYEVLSECFSFLEYSPVGNEEKIYEIMQQAVALRNELIYKANHTSNLDKKQVKNHFRKITEELYEKNIDLIELLNQIKS
jgi:type III secretion system FlhB-like substrate exporter